MICQWLADQLFAEAKGRGKLLICETKFYYNVFKIPALIQKTILTLARTKLNIIIIRSKFFFLFIQPHFFMFAHWSGMRDRSIIASN